MCYIKVCLVLIVTLKLAIKIQLEENLALAVSFFQLLPKIREKKKKKWWKQHSFHLSQNTFYLLMQSSFLWWHSWSRFSVSKDKAHCKKKKLNCCTTWDFSFFSFLVWAYPEILVLHSISPLEQDIFIKILVQNKNKFEMRLFTIVHRRRRLSAESAHLIASPK